MKSNEETRQILKEMKANNEETMKMIYLIPKRNNNDVKMMIILKYSILICEEEMKIVVML